MLLWPRLAVQHVRQRLRALIRAESGQVLVLGVMAMTVLLGAAGMALDLGVATVVKRQAQAAADAAALAGAEDLTGAAAIPTNAQVNTARSDAASTATSNGFTTGGAVNVTVSSPPATSASHNGDVHSVEVTIVKKQTTFLANVLGVKLVTVKGHATATGYGNYTTKPTIALLNPNLPESLDVGLTGAANSPVNINVAGPLVVNSNDPNEAEQTHNNYHLNAPTNVVRGKIDQLGNGTIGPSSQVGQNVIPDPLGGVPIPSAATASTWNTLGTGFKCPPGSTPSLPKNCSGGNSGQLPCNPGTPPSCIVHHYNEMVNPGVWKDLIVDDDGSIVMNPGTYIITGSLQLLDGPTGPGTITGNGVTLYFACPKSTAPYWQNCTPGTGNGNGSGPGGYINLTGKSPGLSPDAPNSLQGTYNLSASTSGAYKGLLIFYDRQNFDPNFGTIESHPTGIQLEGDGRDTLSGTIYAQHTRGLFYSTASTWTINSCFILDTLEIDGLGDYNITCGEAGNYYGSAGTGSATLTE